MSTASEGESREPPALEVGRKELTFGKFAAILLGPAVVLLVAFTGFSLATCSPDCEAEIGGATILGWLATLVVAIRFGIYGLIDLGASVSQKYVQTERRDRIKRGVLRLGFAAALVMVAFVWLVSQLRFG